jgi:GNAT superfamily N-acetyltransferase
VSLADKSRAITRGTNDIAAVTIRGCQSHRKHDDEDVRLRTLTAELVPGVLDLWRRRWESRFPIDYALWKQNTDGDALHFDPKQCWVMDGDAGVEGCIAVKVPADPPAWPGQRPGDAWISFLLLAPGRERDLGNGLIESALSAVRELGFTGVSYGGDPSHFFPGAPIDDVTLCEALDDAGFRPGASVHDLMGDVSGAGVPAEVESTLRRERAEVRSCDRGDIPSLYTFLDCHFPGRWAYETRVRVGVEPQPSDVLLLTRGADVIGFCHVYHERSRRIGPSIYWRRAIGDRYGGLGPIGLARHARGRGLGNALLTLALRYLRDLGVEHVVIDWTTLTDFYGRRDFTVWRTYRPWRREL